MIQWQSVEPKPDIHVRKAALEKFSRRFPERLDIRLGLAGEHLYLGEIESAWDVLGSVAQEHRSEPDWLTAYGKTARKLGHDVIAEDCLSLAWEQNSKIAGLELAILLRAQNRLEEAISVCRALSGRDPANFAVAQILAKNLISAGQLDELGEWAQNLSAEGHWNAVLPSAMAYAGQAAIPNRSMHGHRDPDAFPICIEGFTGKSSHDDLRNILLNHKARSIFPTIYAGKGAGDRIDRVLDLRIPQVTELFDRIKHVVEEYDRHPTRPKASIESWVNICVGDGHEDWHCHPAGWLSGVYYLGVPDLTDAPDIAGQIEFGPLMLGEHNDLERWSKKRFTPKTDMLLLFPSYIGHRTYPTGLQAPRISIAFDIVLNADG